MNQNLTPQRVDAKGRIFSTDEDGNTHIHPTNPYEAALFVSYTKALTAGRDELWLLLHASKTAEGRALLSQDGRTTEQIKTDWLIKVMAAGLSKEAALEWLEGRLKLEQSNPL